MSSQTNGARPRPTGSRQMLNRLSDAGIEVILHGSAVHTLHRDYETRSQIRLSSVGAYKYAGDPSTEVLCCVHAVDDQPVQLWTPGDAVPPAFVEAARNPNWTVVGH